MTQAELIAEIRRLAADPDTFPAAVDGEAQSDDPQPRWTRDEIVRVSNGVLADLSANAPRAFLTGDAYAHAASAPALGADDSASVPGIPSIGKALAFLTASELLADIMDKASAELSEAHARHGRALLEGFIDG